MNCGGDAIPGTELLARKDCLAVASFGLRVAEPHGCGYLEHPGPNA